MRLRFFYRMEWVLQDQWGCSHSAISSACDALVCATSHMIRFHTHSVRLRCAIPVNAICFPIDIYIANRIHTHRTVWTKSLNRTKHSIFWSQSHSEKIVPCERTLTATRPDSTAPMIHSFTNKVLMRTTQDRVKFLHYQPSCRNVTFSRWPRRTRRTNTDMVLLKERTAYKRTFSNHTICYYKV